MLFQCIMKPNSFLTQPLLHVGDDLLFPSSSAARRSLTTSFGAVFLFASDTRGMSPLCMSASVVSSASSGAEVVVATLNTSDLLSCMTSFFTSSISRFLRHGRLPERTNVISSSSSSGLKRHLVPCEIRDRSGQVTQNLSLA